MARDILINPQRSGTGNPTIQFSGSAGNSIVLEVLSAGNVQFSGSNGSLFSIADSTTASIGVGTGTALARFHVSGSSTPSATTALFKSGILSPTGPVVEIQNSEGTSLAVFSGSGNVGITNGSPQTLLHVGSGTYAGTSLAGVRLTNGANSFFNASDGTRTVFLGADGSNAIAGTLTNHDFVLRTNNTERAKFLAGGNFGVTGSIIPGADNVHSLGTPSFVWSNVYANALTGSLTQLKDGSPYIRAGANITVTTGSLGQIVIAASGSSVTTTFTNATNIVFNHNLGNRFVQVQVFDSNYQQIIPKSITLTDQYNATIIFSIAQSGYVLAR